MFHSIRPSAQVYRPSSGCRSGTCSSRNVATWCHRIILGLRGAAAVGAAEVGGRAQPVQVCVCGCRRDLRGRISATRGLASSAATAAGASRSTGSRHEAVGGQAGAASTAPPAHPLGGNRPGLYEDPQEVGDDVGNEGFRDLQQACERCTQMMVQAAPPGELPRLRHPLTSMVSMYPSKPPSTAVPMMGRTSRLN